MNQFVKKYKQLRKDGYNEQESFGYTALHIESRGTMDDLNLVQQVYHQDIFNEWNKLMQEVNKNEKNPVA